MSSLTSHEWVHTYLLRANWNIGNLIILACCWALLCGLFSSLLSGSPYLYYLICLMPSGNNFLFIPLHKILYTLYCS